MKPPLLLTTVILSASPALSGDLIYLKCDALTSITTKQVSTHQVLENKQIAEEAFLKVDTANSRVKINTGRWEDATIANGIAYSRNNVIEGGANITGEFTLESSPPGRLSIQVVTTLGDASQEMSVKGVCQSSDEAAFEKALDQ